MPHFTEKPTKKASQLAGVTSCFEPMGGCLAQAFGSFGFLRIHTETGLRNPKTPRRVKPE